MVFWYLWNVVLMYRIYICIFLDSPRDSHTKTGICRRFVRPRPSNAIKTKLDWKRLCTIRAMFAWFLQRRILQVSYKYWKLSRWPNLRGGSACAFILRRVSEGSTSCYVVGSNFEKCLAVMQKAILLNHVFSKKVKEVSCSIQKIHKRYTKIHRSMNFVERKSIL